MLKSHIVEQQLIEHISRQGFFFNDDTFNFDFAQAKASVGQYQEAQDVISVTIIVHCNYSFYNTQ